MYNSSRAILFNCLGQGTNLETGLFREMLLDALTIHVEESATPGRPHMSRLSLRQLLTPFLAGDQWTVAFVAKDAVFYLPWLATRHCLGACRRTKSCRTFGTLAILPCTSCG